MHYIFYALSPLAFLGSAEFRGNFFIGILRTLVRLAFIFISAFVLTWGLVSLKSFAPPHPIELARQVCLVNAADKTKCPLSVEKSEFADIWEASLQPVSLQHESVLEALKDIDKTVDPRTATFAVQVPKSDGWIDLPTNTTYQADLPEYRVVARVGSGDSTSSVTILEVETALTKIPVPFDLWSPNALYKLWTSSLELDWPFRSINFSSSPYVLSSMVLSAANPDLATRDRDRAKEIMDAHLDAAPGAASIGFIWPRRLNGPLQYVCYLLFFTGLIFIALHWSVNILPNRLLKSTKRFTVSAERFPDGVELSKQLDTKPRYALSDDLSVDEEINSLDSSGEPTNGNIEHLAKTNQHRVVFAPWQKDAIELDTTIREMEAIRDAVTRRSSYLSLGAVPAYPRLDVWIAGLLAMKASRSGENVPSFVSVEIEAAAERLEAHHRLLAFVVWAIPTLGFIGTVIGIGSALLNTVDLQSGEVIKRLQAETSVAIEIGVAFDTTLIALALSLVLMLALHVIQHLEESMLATEKHDALRALVQIENILPDDPIKELRDGLAQMGLAATQVERWTEVLDGQAPKFRDTLNRAEAEIRDWEVSRQMETRRSSLFNLVIAAFVGGGLMAIFFLWNELAALFS